MMKRKLFAWLFSVAIMLSSAYADTFYWKNTGTVYADFGTPANWAMGNSASGETAARAPGENDFLHYTTGYATHQCFDMGGGAYAVKGVDYTGSTLQYGNRYMRVRNGGLTFTEDFYTRRVYFLIQEGGTFTLGETCNTRFGWGGAENEVKVDAGGGFNAYGTLSIGSLRVINSGTVNFDPEQLVLWSESNYKVYSSFENSGEMNFPNGLVYTESADRDASHANENRFVQKAGVMTLGGPIDVSAVEHGSFSFDLVGGELAIVGDVTMAGFTSVGMTTENASAVIDIAAGKTLDWSAAEFADGTSLSVTGSGTIILGLGRPTTLNVAETVTVQTASRLELKGAGLVLNGFDGWENVDLIVSMDFENCPPERLFSSDTQGILEKYLAALTVPEGWTLAIEDGAVVVKSRPSLVFSWQGNQVVSVFSDPAKWTPGKQEGYQNNPYQAVPGAEDMIFYGIGAVYRKFFFDMNGEERSVSGFTDAFANYNDHEMIVTNGTVVFTDNFDNTRIIADIVSGGKLVLGKDSSSTLGLSGAFTEIDILDGGEVDVFGALNIAGTKIRNVPGGKLVFSPASAGMNHEAYENVSGHTGRGIFNSGELVLTNGLDLTIVGGSPTKGFIDTPPVFTVAHEAGRLELGGEFRSTPVDGYSPKFEFVIGGGEIDVTGDASFDDSMSKASITEGAQLDIDIAAGKTLDLSGVRIGSGAVFSVVSGEGGKIVFGVTVPGSLAVTGPITVELGSPGARFDDFTGYADTVFRLGESLALVDGMDVVFSSDSALIARMLATLEIPDGWTASVVGEAVRVFSTAAPDRPVFSVSGEQNLSSAGCWSGPALSAGASVYVSGPETVAVLDGNMPGEIAGIEVKNGATLKIVSVPETMPEITLSLDARLQIPGGADIALPPINANATAGQLPVVEICTGAVVRVGNEYEFKNVHLDLFGELVHDIGVWFGTADAGETAYFSMRAIGATFTNTVSGTGCGTNSFVCPRSPGGRVVSPGGVYLKDVTWMPAYSGYLSHNVGALNPSDEPFTMTLDGCYLDLRGNRMMTFGGAAEIRCVNGGGLKKHDAWCSWGLYGRLQFIDNAKVVLEDGSYFYYVYNQRYTVQFNPAESGCEQLTMKNGSFFAVHVPDGMGRAVARVEDSYYDVMQLPAHSYKENGVEYRDPRPDWYWDAFNGFKAIHVPAGKFFGMRAGENFAYGDEWNRVLAIGAPITGEGDLIVTNSAPGLAVDAVVKRADNTAVGEAKSCLAECRLVFADGANWAGTLVGSEGVAFTNLVDGAGAATVSLGSVRCEGNLALRVWRGEAATNDYLVLSGALTAGARKRGLMAVDADGGEITLGESFIVGSYPKSAGAITDIRAFAARGWTLESVDPGEASTEYLLKLTRHPDINAIIVR